MILAMCIALQTGRPAFSVHLQHPNTHPPTHTTRHSVSHMAHSLCVFQGCCQDIAIAATKRHSTANTENCTARVRFRYQCPNFPRCLAQFHCCLRQSVTRSCVCGRCHI